MKLEEVILRDDRASQPAANTVPAGTLYYVTDEGVTERSTGSAWEDWSDSGTVADDSITNAKLRNSAAVSVIGRSANSTGDPADIAAGANDRVLGRTGDALSFQQITVGMLTDNTITPAKLTAAAKTHTVGIVIDGGGSAITTGVKGYIQVPIGGTITAVRMLADQSGSIVVDVWKDTYANYPPTDADSITAAAPPTISSAIKSEDTTLTGWTTSITAGDILGFNVDSATTVTRVTLQITFTGS
jgi:hypothetical protein